jgi:membrane protein
MEGSSTSHPGWPEHSRLLPWRQRSPVVDLAVLTIDGYGRHRTGRNAALISHYGFLSVFPLVLVMTTILGFVLDGREDLQEKIIDSVLAELPIIGQTIASDPTELTGSTPVLIFGVVLALWSGLRAFVAMQIAIDDVQETPRHDRVNFAAMRGRALIGVGVIGGSQIASATITTLVSAGEFAVINRILLAISALVLNIATILLTFHWLASVKRSWRATAPGAAAAGFVFTMMQYFGTTVIVRIIANASPVYGTFATVIGLFTWLGLHATVALLGAELNEALRARNLRRDLDGAPLPSVG